MKRIIFFLLLALPIISFAQPNQEEDPFAGAFIDPELVMANQDKIGLTKEQRSYLIDEVQAAQKLFTEMHWDLTAKMGELQELVFEYPIKEEKVMTLLNEVLTMENKIKKQQLLLMLRIKNKLTADQIKQLEGMRK